MTNVKTNSGWIIFKAFSNYRSCHENKIGGILSHQIYLCVVHEYIYESPKPKQSSEIPLRFEEILGHQSDPVGTYITCKYPFDCDYPDCYTRTDGGIKCNGEYQASIYQHDDKITLESEPFYE